MNNFFLKNTALHLAAQCGQENVVVDLLDKHAKFLTNIYGQTFMDLAIENRHCVVLQTIISHKR